MITIDGYPIDCAKLIDHSMDADVSEEPIESGGVVTDHVEVLPKRLTIEGWVSDTPIGAMVLRRQQEAILTGDAFAEPAAAGFTRLSEIHEAREPVTVDTDRKRYENMILRRLSVPEDVNTGDALMFTAEFVQIKIVESDRLTVRVSVPRAKGKKNLGHAPATPQATPPPDYLLADSSTDPRFVGANSGGRRVVAFGGGEGSSTRVPIASGGSP